MIPNGSGVIMNVTALPARKGTLLNGGYGAAMAAKEALTRDLSAELMGINLFRYKTLAFALSGLYAGIAGGLYAALLNFVAPDTFDLFQVVMHKAMVVLGGIGSIVGSVLGALILVVANEGLREFKGKILQITNPPLEMDLNKIFD